MIRNLFPTDLESRLNFFIVKEVFNFKLEKIQDVEQMKADSIQKINVIAKVRKLNSLKFYYKGKKNNKVKYDNFVKQYLLNRITC